MKEELKPCPFCGCKAEIFHWGRLYTDKHWGISCCECDATIYSDKEELVIEAWNTRTQPENNSLTLDEVKELKDGDVVWLSTDGFLEPIIIINILSTVINFGYFINSKGGSQIDLTDINKYYFIYRNKPYIADFSKKEEQK